MNRIAFYLMGLVLLVSLLGCENQRGTMHALQAAQEVVWNGNTMGTTFAIKIVDGRYGEDTPELKGLKGRVAKALEAINASMSTWEPDSEITKINESRESTPHKISDQLFEVLQMAWDVSDLSGGAFDITVGPLVNAYGFGAGESIPDLPGSEKFEALRKNVGYKFLQLSAADKTVTKKNLEVYCDLAAIAKGYGVDVVADLLEADGVKNYMVEVGGEVRAKGVNSKDIPWRIGIEKPMDDGSVLQAVLSLKDMAVATSGDYRNFYMQDGKRVSHTIDARTGRTIEHHLASVTVVDDKCARADGLATALMVLGPDEGFHLAEREGIAAMFLVRTGENVFEEKTTKKFPEYEKRGE